MPSGDSERGERLAYALLLVAMAVSAATILIVNRNLTFWSDELNWLTLADDFAPAHLLRPHNSHLIATTRAIYEGLPRVFGTSYLPFRILAVICLQAGAVLTFVLVRRRLGAAIAALPAIVFLFYGSAQDMVISPLGIPFTLSIALGLGAFVAVDRRTLGGDLLAMVLLALSMLSHTFGAIIAVGLLCYYGLDRGRRRELWVPLLPLVLWIIWWLWARQFDQGIAAASNLLGTPLFLVEAAGAALEGIVGVPPGNPVELPLRVGFDLVAIAAATLLIARLFAGRVTAWTWAYLVTLLAFWFGIGLAAASDREPSTPRYLYFGAIMIVLIAAEVLRDRVASRTSYRLLVAFASVCLVGNFTMILRIAPDYEQDALDVRAQIGALNVAGRAGPVAPDLFIDAGSPISTQIVVSPNSILAFENDVGPLGFDVDELRDQPEEVRQGADFVLIRGLGVEAVQIPAGSDVKRIGCALHRPADDGYTSFDLEPGVSLLALVRDTGEPGATLDLGRFADAADVPIGDLREGHKAVVVLPDDGLDDPWTARTTGTVRVCRIVLPGG